MTPDPYAPTGERANRIRPFNYIHSFKFKGQFFESEKIDMGAKFVEIKDD